MSEIFEVEDVKIEFLQKVGLGYSQAFAPKQLELALYVLNDFCNSLTSNGLVLLRQSQSQQPISQQQYQAPLQYQQMPFQQQSMQPQLMQGDPFQEGELMQQRIQQNIIEMNNSLKRPGTNRGSLNDVVPSVPEQRSRTDDVNLASQKPKSFVDGLKAMRSSRKPARPSDDDDE